MSSLSSRFCLLWGLFLTIEGSWTLPAEISPRIVHHPSDVLVKVGSPATLSCRAEGYPEPTIEWYYNGLPLATDKLSQPIILSDKSLFFLSVAPGKKGNTHEGVYTCVAKNSAGRAASRNATLYIEALREEFRTQPSDVLVAEGEMAVFNCTPPVGHPEPNITWKRDGVLLTDDERYTVYNGKLVIAPTQKNDSGLYACVASNTVAERVSRGAHLSVRAAKPKFFQKPQDLTVNIGDTAQFSCEVHGDPMPTVRWSREQGPLPNERYIVNPNKSLQLYYVMAQDAGRYTCTVISEAGMSSASALLFVQEEESTKQRDLHRELSALRVGLDSVTVLSSVSSMLQLQWTLQSSVSQPHHLDGFEILYRSIHPATSDWAAKRVTFPHSQTMIGPLKRAYQYEFKVRPYGSGLYGRESNTRHLQVPEIAPGAPPGNIAVTFMADRNDTIQVTWEPPPYETHNGIIQGYQVWCVQGDSLQSLNWTVSSATHNLEVSSLDLRKQYSVRVAAVNGAGIGVQSESYRFSIGPQQALSPYQSSSETGTQFLAVLRDPVFIGSLGAILWCVLMVMAVCLYCRHSHSLHLRRSHHKATGLYQMANEDLIIKHRMATPDSPWLSSPWRSAQARDQYQSLWAQSQEDPALKRITLPAQERKAITPLESSVPIVPDTCGIYGTFYVDLTSNGLKTFDSPARRPKMPHPNPQPSQTAHLSSPLLKTTVIQEARALPWKHPLPVQPRMGVLKEPWEKNGKKELHAVNSAPLVPTCQQLVPVRTPPTAQQQRLSHQTPGGLSDHSQPLSSPRLLHYSASVHLIDMLPTPPPMPLDETQSLSSEEGSSRSTKLTVDGGSVRSLCPAPLTSDCLSYSRKPYSRMSTASFCMSVDDDHDTALTSQEVAQYLELSLKAERRSVLSKRPMSPPRPFSPTPTMGYICGPSDLDAEDTKEDAAQQQRQYPAAQWDQMRATPSSCCSEWEGSLWNGWGSVTDSNAPSARDSMISTSDGSFMNDANFARALAVAAESLGGTSLSDFSPPSSPLSTLFTPRDCFGDLDPLPVWQWSTAWVEEMEAQFQASMMQGSNSEPEVVGRRQDNRRNAPFPARLDCKDT